MTQGVRMSERTNFVPVENLPNAHALMQRSLGHDAWKPVCKMCGRTAEYQFAVVKQTLMGLVDRDEWSFRGNFCDSLCYNEYHVSTDPTFSRDNYDPRD